MNGQARMDYLVPLIILFVIAFIIWVFAKLLVYP